MFQPGMDGSTGGSGSNGGGDDDDDPPPLPPRRSQYDFYRSLSVSASFSNQSLEMAESGEYPFGCSPVSILAAQMALDASCGHRLPNHHHQRQVSEPVISVDHGAYHPSAMIRSFSPSGHSFDLAYLDASISTDGRLHRIGSRSISPSPPPSIPSTSSMRTSMNCGSLKMSRHRSISFHRMRLNHASVDNDGDDKDSKMQGDGDDPRRTRRHHKKPSFFTCCSFLHLIKKGGSKGKPKINTASSALPDPHAMMEGHRRYHPTDDINLQHVVNEVLDPILERDSDITSQSGRSDLQYNCLEKFAVEEQDLSGMEATYTLPEMALLPSECEQEAFSPISSVFVFDTNSLADNMYHKQHYRLTSMPESLMMNNYRDMEYPRFSSSTSCNGSRECLIRDGDRPSMISGRSSYTAMIPEMDWEDYSHKIL